MYAYVQFLVDKVKAIVPVKDIKNFNADSFEMEATRAYEVFWTSENGEGTGYWFAVVLLVAETEELIHQRMKRLKFPPLKRLEELLAMTLDEEAKKSVVGDESRKKSKEIQEKRSACEKDKLKEILKRKLTENKTNESSDEDGRGAGTSKVQRGLSPSQSESSDGDALLRSELKRMSGEYEKARRKLKLKQEENMQLKKKNDKLQELNISLQTQLLSLLSAHGSLGQNPPPTRKLPEIVGTGMNNFPKERVEAIEGSGSLLGQTPPPQEKPDTLRTTDFYDPETVAVSNTERNSAPTLEGSDSSFFEPLANGLYLHDNGSLMKWEDEQMMLAPGVSIRKDQWQKIISCKKLNESRLTRNLAVTLWGSETLIERSVTGNACKRFKKNGIEAKMALTPMKVDAVQNGLRFWLTEYQGKKEQEVLKLSSSAAIRKMLSDKIMDLAKQQKKNLSKTL